MTDRPAPVDNTTRGTAILAGALWALWLFAVVCLAAGDDEAITGVIGFGVAAVAFTASWWAFRRQDRRLAADRTR